MSDEQIFRATRAQQIIEDPLFVEAFDGMEKGAVERIAACDANDKEKLQALALSLQAIRATRRRFVVWMAEGEDAARRQMQREEAPSLIDRFRRRA
jgi:hypothetical protein